MKNIKIKEAINKNFKLNEDNNEDEINENFKRNEVKDNKNDAENEEKEVTFNEVHVLSRAESSRLKLLFIF